MTAATRATRSRPPSRLPEHLGAPDRHDQGGVVARQRPTGGVEDHAARRRRDDLAGAVLRGRAHVVLVRDDLDVPQPAQQRHQQRQHEDLQHEQPQPGLLAHRALTQAIGVLAARPGGPARGPWTRRTGSSRPRSRTAVGTSAVTADPGHLGVADQGTHPGVHQDRGTRRDRDDQHREEGRAPGRARRRDPRRSRAARARAPSDRSRGRPVGPGRAPARHRSPTVSAEAGPVGDRQRHDDDEDEVRGRARQGEPRHERHLGGDRPR